MRVLGHPVHVMVIHFPIALWPAHWFLQLFSAMLPQPGGGIVAFWLLVTGTGLGWLAAFAGAADLIEVLRSPDVGSHRAGWWHAGVNGSVLAAFSVLALVEYANFPHVVHGWPMLVGEAAVLAALMVGNYFGGAMVWRSNSAGSSSP
jgi:uncharacterized membrane protein